MPHKFRITLAAVISLTLCLVNLALAGGGRCQHCGCDCDCCKVCRLVDDEKKVTITCWGGLREDFCIPGHSHRDCKHCEMVCDECDEPCDEDAPVTHPKKFVWYDWCPGCSKGIRTKTKLMKKTITKKIPSYKWVVEDLCDDCRDKCQCVMVEPNAKVPTPPVAAVTLKYGVRLFSGDDAERPVVATSTQIAPVSSQSQSSIFKAIFSKP